MNYELFSPVRLPALGYPLVQCLAYLLRCHVGEAVQRVRIHALVHHLTYRARGNGLRRRHHLLHVRLVLVQHPVDVEHHQLRPEVLLLPFLLVFHHTSAICIDFGRACQPLKFDL